MKSSVLGLFSLALLGFVCTEGSLDGSEKSTTTAAIDNARTNTRTTRETDDDNNNGNDDDKDNDDNSDTSDTTTSPPAVNTNTTNTTSGMLGPKPTAMTGGLKSEASKGGQGHIFTAVSLLLGSLVLLALWQ